MIIASTHASDSQQTQVLQTMRSDEFGQDENRKTLPSRIADIARKNITDLFVCSVPTGIILEAGAGDILDVGANIGLFTLFCQKGVCACMFVRV